MVDPLALLGKMIGWCLILCITYVYSCNIHTCIHALTGRRRRAWSTSEEFAEAASHSKRFSDIAEGGFVNSGLVYFQPELGTVAASYRDKLPSWQIKFDEFGNTDLSNVFQVRFCASWLL